MESRVSVIIPTYNYGRFIAEAIGSVLVQTHPPFEIVIVDDGSTDDTRAVLREFGNQVKYIRQENAGVCAARNRGVAESAGEFIAFLDADDTWEPTKIEKQLAVFAANPSIGLVHCGTREFDSATGETMRFNVNGAEEELAKNLILWEDTTMPAPATVMLRRQAFDSVGGFDVRMKCGEDWDFCYRVARKFQAGFVPEPLLNYRFHSEGAHSNVHEMERGMSLFYEKAFDTDDPAVLRLKRRSYSNFHRVLAGSYFHSRQYSKFASHSVRSILHHPSSLLYFAKFPFRRMA